MCATPARWPRRRPRRGRVTRRRGCGSGSTPSTRPPPTPDPRPPRSRGGGRAGRRGRRPGTVRGAIVGHVAPVGVVAVRAHHRRDPPRLHPGRQAPRAAADRRGVPLRADLRRRRRPAGQGRHPRQRGGRLETTRGRHRRAAPEARPRLQALQRDLDGHAHDDEHPETAPSEAWWGWDDQGRFRGEWDLRSDDGATLEAGLEARLADLRPTEADIDTNPVADGDLTREERSNVRKVDALVALADNYLAAAATTGCSPSPTRSSSTATSHPDGSDPGPVDSLFPTTLAGCGPIDRRLAECCSATRSTITVEMIGGFPVSEPTASAHLQPHPTPRPTRPRPPLPVPRLHPHPPPPRPPHQTLGPHPPHHRRRRGPAVRPAPHPRPPRAPHHHPRHRLRRHRHPPRRHHPHQRRHSHPRPPRPHPPDPTTHPPTTAPPAPANPSPTTPATPSSPCGTTTPIAEPRHHRATTTPTPPDPTHTPADRPTTSAAGHRHDVMP